MAKDKKGKGSGSKDACYHKVKSRYSVWPSAYASGALVKCRKVGAANWGNKSESFEVQESPSFEVDKSEIPKDKMYQTSDLSRRVKKNMDRMRNDPNHPVHKVLKANAEKKKQQNEEVESVEEGKSDRPLGVMHQFARGVKQKRGAKKDEGGKYLKMQTTKKQNKKSADADAYRERQRNERGLSMYPEEVEVTEGKYSKSETYVKGTAPVRATYGGKTESFPKETYKKKSKKVEVSEGDKYDNVGKQAARMSLLNNPGPRSTPEQTAEKKARLEKKRGMKLDDHPQYKKEEVEEGYRVVSTSFKSGDGDPKDDVTIKKQKKVVSGDNLTKKGAERSANARRQEYGAGDAFQVQKTKTAKKRSSNAASEAEVKAKIDAKEKKQQKSRAQQSIAGMNRAGTPSGKVAAARLKTDKKFNKEEVDKRRAPSELVARLSAKREGHMAQDGPNKAAYDAKQRILKKTKDKMTEEIVRSILDEAGKKCWKGYKKAGTQKLFGKTYNRCVKANEELSIDQQMKISRDYNRMSPEEKKAANKKAMGNVKKVAPKKDTRTDAQKMTDATGPRPGSRYRGD